MQEQVNPITLKLGQLNDIPAIPIMPAPIVEENITPTYDDIFENYDWDRFTMGGIYIVNALVIAINKKIQEFNRLKDRKEGEGLCFTWKDIFKEVGMDSIGKLDKLLLPSEEEMYYGHDEDWKKWRHYVCQKALEKFEDHWDIEVIEAERIDTIDMLYNLISTLDTTRNMTTDEINDMKDDPAFFDEIICNYNERLMFEDLIVMFPAEDDEEYEEDE